MNTFPILAAFTLCASFAILSATFDDLRETPFMLDAAAKSEAAARLLPAGLEKGTRTPLPDITVDASEGLMDHELASADPLQAWLDRYLTPPAK
jgi:hypothetical protein